MLEIEAKYPVKDFSTVEYRLQQLGAALQEEREDIDHYYNAPDRDFGQTDEALRVRRIGSANYLTYKGPKRDALTKTRTEVEVPFAPGAATAQDLLRLLEHLKYRPSGIVHKHRRVFALQRGGYHVEITLDEVTQLGRFVEVEILAPEQELESARSVLLELAENLGLGAAERRSYLEMCLLASGKAQGRSGTLPGG